MTRPFPWRAPVLALFTLAAAGLAQAHGDVTPQAVDTRELPARLDAVARFLRLANVHAVGGFRPAGSGGHLTLELGDEQLKVAISAISSSAARTSGVRSTPCSERPACQSAV